MHLPTPIVLEDKISACDAEEEPVDLICLHAYQCSQENILVVVMQVALPSEVLIQGLVGCCSVLPGQLDLSPLQHWFELLQCHLKS